MEKRRFFKYVEQYFREDHWSMDSCAVRAIASKKFQRSETSCTKTLYNYIDLGFLPIKSIDLPARVSRKTKKQKIRKNKRILDRSIEERPENIDTRTEFGHWEIELVIGRKSAEDEVPLMMIERKTRSLHILRLQEKSTDSVIEPFALIKLDLGDRFDQVFRSITTDNSSEFSRLSELEIDSGCMVFYAHLYSFCEKGAELILCRLSHCIGCFKEYNGSTIIYGQGDFLFDNSENECWQTVLLISVDDFSVNYIPLKKAGNTVCLADKNYLLKF